MVVIYFSLFLFPFLSRKKSAPHTLRVACGSLWFLFSLRGSVLEQLLCGGQPDSGGAPQTHPVFCFIVLQMQGAMLFFRECPCVAF